MNAKTLFTKNHVIWVGIKPTRGKVLWPWFQTCQKKQCIYLARTNCWLGLLEPGPVGLHRMVYISYKIMHPSDITIWESYTKNSQMENNKYLNMFPQIMQVFVLLHTPYLCQKILEFLIPFKIKRNPWNKTGLDYGHINRVWKYGG